MENFNPQLHAWVLINLSEHWTNALFPLRRWNKMYSNQAESFNLWVRKERALSINRFMIEQNKRVQEFFYRRKVEAYNSRTNVGPRTKGKIREKIRLGESFACVKTIPTSCYLIHNWNTSYKVVLMDRTCSCLEWSMIWILCIHVCRARQASSLTIYDIVKGQQVVDAQRAIFNHLITPILAHLLLLPSELEVIYAKRNRTGEDTVLIRSPTTKRSVGRSRKNYSESQFQGKNINHYLRCSEACHNHRECKNSVHNNGV